MWSDIGLLALVLAFGAVWVAIGRLQPPSRRR